MGRSGHSSKQKKHFASTLKSIPENEVVTSWTWNSSSDMMDTWKAFWCMCHRHSLHNLLGTLKDRFILKLVQSERCWGFPLNPTILFTISYLLLLRKSSRSCMKSKAMDIAFCLIFLIIYKFGFLNYARMQLQFKFLLLFSRLHMLK